MKQAAVKTTAKPAAKADTLTQTGDPAAVVAAGMAIAIEPMVNQGGADIVLAANKWTVYTKDGKLSAHYENTVIVTDDDPLIVTM